MYLEAKLPWEFSAPTPDEVARAARRLNMHVTSTQADALVADLRTRFARERARPRVSEVVPALETLPALAEDVMRETRRRAHDLRRLRPIADVLQEPWARNFEIRTGADLWEIFFYCLVDPRARGGPSLNAADRLRRGHAYFVPAANRVLFYSPDPVLSMSSIAR